MTGNNYDVVDTSLPTNFFEQIIINEVELSEGFQYEKLSTLVQLYLNAIQYYSTVSPEKVKAYQNRLEFLLTQKDTLKNLCNRRNEEIKSSKSSTQIRGSAKTIFKIQSKNIKKEDIKNKVNKVMDENKNIKVHKKNVKILIKNDFDNQNKKWKEKLAQKRSMMNPNHTLLRTSGRKFFNTPGPIIRKSLNIESKIEVPKFEKSGKNIPKYGNIDDDDSMDDNKSENNTDLDVLKLFKERHNKNEDKKDSDDEGSIIDDNYNDDDIFGKIEEVEEEHIKCSEKNVIMKIENAKENEKKPLKGILKNKDKSSNEQKEKNIVKNNEINTDINNGDLSKDKFKEINNEEKKENDKKPEEKKEKIEENNFVIKKDEENTEKEKKENTENNNGVKNEEDKKNEKWKDSEEKTEEIKKEKKDEENEEISKENKKEEKKNEEERNNFLEATCFIKENNEEINIEKMKPLQRKKSIENENVLRDIEPDEEIKKSIEEKMQLLNSLKSENELEEDSNFQSSSNLPVITNKINMDDIPPIFQETLIEVKEKVKEFINSLKDKFYKETFEDFSLKLKELYDSKYDKYIMINNEYHSSIIEKEHLLETEENLNEKKKIEIQSIIDSLKEEQKDQIDKIVDEYNNNIILLINEFKQNSFKRNASIQLLEEQLKLDVYTMINDSFY